MDNWTTDKHDTARIYSQVHSDDILGQLLSGALDEIEWTRKMLSFALEEKERYRILSEYPD